MLSIKFISIFSLIGSKWTLKIHGLSIFHKIDRSPRARRPARHERKQKMTAQPTYSVFSKRTVEQISRTEHHCGSWTMVVRKRTPQINRFDREADISVPSRKRVSWFRLVPHERHEHWTSFVRLVLSEAFEYNAGGTQQVNYTTQKLARWLVIRRIGDRQLIIN